MTNGKRRIGAVLLVVVVLLAGCSSGVPAGSGGTTAGTGSGAAPTGDTGTLSFYVSDQASAIGDFSSLTVTVTEVGVHRAGVAGAATTSAGDGANATEPVASETATNATPTDGNGTVTPNSTAVPTTAETRSADGGNASADGNETSGAGWTTVAVDNATVDLTELQGANATQIANASLPSGEYNGVYVQVSNVTGTLQSGETVTVKLPSDRLRLNRGFSLGANQTTSFVFDIAVHEAGGSGKYVLRPVIGQSGADVPIRDVGATTRAKNANAAAGSANGNPSTAAGTSNRSASGSASADLKAQLVGSVRAGQETTVRVTRGGDPVANASVVVNGDAVGSTGADGRLSVDVPAADTLDVVVGAGNESAETTRAIR